MGVHCDKRFSPIAAEGHGLILSRASVRYCTDVGRNKRFKEGRKDEKISHLPPPARPAKNLAGYRTNGILMVVIFALKVYIRGPSYSYTGVQPCKFSNDSWQFLL